MLHIFGKCDSMALVLFTVDFSNRIRCAVVFKTSIQMFTHGDR